MNLKIILKAIEITYIIGITYEYFKLKKNHIHILNEVNKLLIAIKAIPEIEAEITDSDER